MELESVCKLDQAIESLRAYIAKSESYRSNLANTAVKYFVGR